MKISEALALLEAEHGFLTPRMVVEAARPPDAPLHGYVFDRSVEEAAESWWIHKAQDLIQSVKVRTERPDGPDLIVRKYVSVDLSTGPVYKDVTKVAQDPISKEVALAEMRREWQNLQSRYKGYLEFWELVADDLPEELTA